MRSGEIGLKLRRGIEMCDERCGNHLPRAYVESISTASPTMLTARRSSQLWLTPTCAMFDVPIEMGP